MAKSEKIFHCNECGAEYPKWLGKCEDCGQWNSIVEDTRVNGASISEKFDLEFQNLSFFQEKIDRRLSDIGEFDRVLGGGAVPGSVVLIGGDPGIGKSTLLLQVSAALSQDYSCVYISGEESAEQICMRAERLEAANSDVKLACETNVGLIIKSLGNDVDFLVVDSIQTLRSSFVDSIPGTVSQVRTCAYELINFAKTTGATVFLVGHVTKDGAIAGPKVLEHMVDTVLYFEGERGNAYRILRSVKNRYGPCDELGIFEMRQEGLVSVQNPSVLFLTQRDNDVPGTVVFSGIEGSRPMLVEAQALVSKSYFTSPRRTVVGWDLNRLFTILAVLESKCRISFSDRDVYLSIAGGLKISEPACDLAAALSLLSARSGHAIARETCAFGEIGLTGEIRSVSRCSERVKEAEKLGFKNIILPHSNKFPSVSSSGINLMAVKTLMDAIATLGISQRHE
ncbi:MAG: DNA repair protein RadA [Holosporaceae bacterium]|jgi:DNA repair protein RadA/Sms|nr:DNA repair protein RadA [Holosporaceae bacterium]